MHGSAVMAIRDDWCDAARIRAAFDATTAGTVGIEEELLVLEPETFLPIPRGDDVAAAAIDPRIKREMPACQIEIATLPHAEVADTIAELEECRRRVALVAASLGLRIAAAAVHPVVSRIGPSPDDRHREIFADYGEIARRQLVGSLQVHVAVGSASLALSTYNRLRSHLPEIAALAASAPFHDGMDTGLASIRPIVAGQLPRQGVPPAIESWDRFAEDLAWGRSAGSLPEPRRWWWELRPHVLHGTLEVRVADVQATTRAAAAITQVIVALVGWLVARLADGEPVQPDPSWRIEENRWRALRDGVHGTQVDLQTGEPIPTSRRLLDLLDEIEPFSTDGLDPARALVHRNGADMLRRLTPANASQWLAEIFAPSPIGSSVHSHGAMR